VPVKVFPPGERVKVHIPEDGNPYIVTLPVDSLQVGCTIVPTDGADGVGGWVFITISADEAEVQPTELVTV
jgi:hypothetical protein